MKVYLVILEYEQHGTIDTDIRVAGTLEQAHKIFKEFEQETIVANMLEDHEYCERDEFNIFAYDYDDTVKLYIMEKAVE